MSEEMKELQGDYQGIIFDLDGTLSDSVPVILKCAELTQEELGVPWDEAKQRALIGTPLYQSAAIICGENQVEDYLKIFRKHSEVYLSKLITPFPGVVEMLQTLHQEGIKIGVVTSRLKWGAELSCEVIGITPYLDAIIAVEDTETHKPDPEPAFLALERMGVPPEKGIFVGDASVDINCGHNAGMATMAVEWGVSTPETLADCKPTWQVSSVQAMTGKLYELCKINFIDNK